MAKTPPSVRKLDLLNLAFKKSYDFFGFLMENRKKYGEVYKIDVGFTEFYMFNHPNHAKHIFVSEAKNFEKGGDNPLLKFTRDFIGNGLPMSDGVFWQRQRRLMQPAFHRTQMLQMSEQMFQAVEEMLDTEWETVSALGYPFDVSQAFARITMKVITRAAFGSDLTKYELELMIDSMSTVMNSIFKGAVFNTLPNFISSSKQYKYQKAIQTVDDIVYRVIEKRRCTPTNDLISMLVHMVDDETNEQMTPQQLRDEVTTLFLAGYETTATGLLWVLHHLTQQPELQSKLQQEVDEVLDGKIPDYFDLKKLAYTERLFKESLRLYPPTYWSMRNAIDSDVIDGYKIPAKANIAVVVYAIHRHPEFWNDPHTFNPERFSPECLTEHHPYAWIPFGVGQHSCIGREFAMIEARYILARLMQKYEFISVPGRKAMPRPSMLISTQDGVWVYLKKRL